MEISSDDGRIQLAHVARQDLCRVTKVNGPPKAGQGTISLQADAEDGVSLHSSNTFIALSLPVPYVTGSGITSKGLVVSYSAQSRHTTAGLTQGKVLHYHNFFPDNSLCFTSVHHLRTRTAVHLALGDSSASLTLLFHYHPFFLDFFRHVLPHQRCSVFLSH
ncbi:hypothetical protein E2C01_006432 [Portunus trituberculatus]|uniref:Uncharacterized protein n=1 Tax=Portunus trituberculatus TaxID=210409 RepID=A0A5B7CWA5_PORTR|nr:hypothetical protein [Portunus trituberculatus]